MQLPFGRCPTWFITMADIFFFSDLNNSTVWAGYVLWWIIRFIYELLYIADGPNNVHITLKNTLMQLLYITVEKIALKVRQIHIYWDSFSINKSNACHFLPLIRQNPQHIIHDTGIDYLKKKMFLSHCTQTSCLKQLVSFNYKFYIKGENNRNKGIYFFCFISSFHLKYNIKSKEHSIAFTVK